MPVDAHVHVRLSGAAAGCEGGRAEFIGGYTELLQVGAASDSHNETAGLRVQTLTVPEGLILLISVTAAVSAFKLARRGVLAQQLNAIESLASVDILCTDKTSLLCQGRVAIWAFADRTAASDEGSVKRPEGSGWGC